MTGSRAEKQPLHFLDYVEKVFFLGSCTALAGAVIWGASVLRDLYSSPAAGSLAPAQPAATPPLQSKGLARMEQGISITEKPFEEISLRMLRIWTEDIKNSDGKALFQQTFIAVPAGEASQKFPAWSMTAQNMRYSFVPAQMESRYGKTFAGDVVLETVPKDRLAGHTILPEQRLPIIQQNLDSIVAREGAEPPLSIEDYRALRAQRLFLQLCKKALWPTSVAER